MPIQVLLCDDRREEVEDWLGDIRGAVGSDGVTALGVEEFKEAIAALEQRRATAFVGEEWSGSHPFDSVDVLVLDYDLTLLEEGRFITGEAIAYLARCFSLCGLIIGMNQFKAGFDLSLAGHPESYADVNIRSSQIGNPGLWSSRRSGFRPWSWPQLVEELGAFRDRCSSLEGCLDQPILEHLGLTSIEASLPRSVLEFLEGDQSPVQTTFRDFVATSDHGARLPEPLPDAMTARVAAARVASWFAQTLLPMQEVVIDAPHLVMRIPALAPTATDPDMKALTQLYTELSLPSLEIASAARIGAPMWTGRQCWYWANASETSATLPVAATSDLVFCEDMSRFFPRAAARPFVAELPSAYRRRFVFDPESPAGRAIEDMEQWSYSPLDVDYRPSVRFAI